MDTTPALGHILASEWTFDDLTLAMYCFEFFFNHVFSKTYCCCNFGALSCYGYVSFLANISLKICQARLHQSKLNCMTLLQVPHVTSQPTTLLHVTPQAPYDIKTGRITTMEQQKARSRQRNGLGIALVGRLAHIQYIHVFAMLGPNTLQCCQSLA